MTVDWEKDFSEWDSEPDSEFDTDVEITATDLTGADRLLRQAHALDQEAAKIQEVVDAGVGRYQAWGSDRMSGITQHRGRIASVLEAFMRRWHSETRRKTEPLVYGTLKLTKARERVIVEDEEAFIAWALDPDNPERLELIETKIVPVKTTIAKECSRTDEEQRHVDGKFGTVITLVHKTGVVPGVKAFQPGDDVFSFNTIREGFGR